MKKIRLFLVIILASFFCNAQNWKSGIGISDQIVRDIIEYNSDTLIAGVEKKGVFISYDKGRSWTQFALNGESIYSLIKIDRTIIAGTEGHDIYRSNSINSTWERVVINNLVVNELKSYNGIVYACTYGSAGPGGIYTSSDHAKTWQQYGTSIPPYQFLSIDFNPNGRIYAATPNGAYYSDKPSSWISTGIGGTVWTVNYIGKDSILYGDESNGILFSNDNGATGHKLEIFGRRTFFIDDTIYAASSYELMFTKSLSEGWKNLNLNRSLNRLTKIQNQLFAATTEGVYIFSSSPTKNNSIKSQNFGVFPNPTTGLFELDGIEPEKFLLEIFNSNGQKVLESQNLRNDISVFEPGIYILRIEHMNNKMISKIIKQ